MAEWLFMLVGPKMLRPPPNFSAEQPKMSKRNSDWQGAMRSASIFGSSKSIILCWSKQSSKPGSSLKGPVQEPPEHLHLLEATHRSLRNWSDTSLELSSLAGLHLFDEASWASSSDSAFKSFGTLLELGCPASHCTCSSSDSSETGHKAIDAMHHFTSTYY